jgi:hypothetical protein
MPISFNTTTDLAQRLLSSPYTANSLVDEELRDLKTNRFIDVRSLSPNLLLRS